VASYKAAAPLGTEALINWTLLTAKSSCLRGNFPIEPRIKKAKRRTLVTPSKARVRALGLALMRLKEKAEISKGAATPANKTNK